MTHSLKDSGFKITVQRRRILEVLENSVNKHLSAEDLYNLLKVSGEEVGLATVYRVLTQFEAAGIVTKHNFEENCAVFELSMQDHHDHLVCIKCDAIIEFFDDIIETRQREIAKGYDFEITDHSLSIYGVCNKCKQIQ